MNERIQELYRQAHSIRHYDGDPALDGNPPTVYWQDETSAQRFAELIVRECANLAKDESLSIVKKAELYAEPDEIHTAKATAWQFLVLEAKMKKHFGVES